MKSSFDTPAGRTLIIGFGDPLHGDDGVGWQVASLLASSLKDHETDIRIAMQLAPDMVEPVSHAELVIFIDTAHDAHPGEWTCEEIFPGADMRAHSCHEGDALRLMEFSRLIFHSRPRAVLVSIGAKFFESSNHLMRVTEEVVPKVVRFVREMVAELNAA
ncbi:MAG TPA: hydrogenase maturation protease [Candidatus Methylacidiphilales bacterium]|jgi:hydrogenase maturation protease|nr:hydrogenase maturation protease [Candidatus Methylacidiphilales bacterium]